VLSLAKNYQTLLQTAIYQLLDQRSFKTTNVTVLVVLTIQL
jgi:hypothetical protein